VRAGRFGQSSSSCTPVCAASSASRASLRVHVDAPQIRQEHLSYSPSRPALEISAVAVFALLAVSMALFAAGLAVFGRRDLVS
jgi:hypothetical protein